MRCKASQNSREEEFAAAGTSVAVLFLYCLSGLLSIPLVVSQCLGIFGGDYLCTAPIPASSRLGNADQEPRWATWTGTEDVYPNAHAAYVPAFLYSL